MSVKRVATHIQAMSQQFSESGTSVGISLDQKSLESLVALLSLSLQAAITGHRFQQGIFSSGGADGEEGTAVPESFRNGSFPPSSCELQGPVSAQQVVQLVTDVVEMPTDLMLVRENYPATPPLTFQADLQLSDHLVLPTSRPTCCLTPFSSIGSPATSLSCTPCAKTGPPWSSAGTQPPSTCRTPLSYPGETPKAGRVSRACWPC